MAVIVQPRATFEAAGKDKTTWLILLAVGLVLFGPVGGLLGIVYLAGVRPKIRRHAACPISQLVTDPSVTRRPPRS